MMSLIGTLIVVIVVTVFAGFNKDYTCSINLLYRTFDNVPVFLAIMASFVAGVIVALPYAFFHRHARKEKIKAKEDELKKEHDKNHDKKVVANDKNSDAKADSGDVKKFSLFGKKKKDDEKLADASSAQDEKPADISPEAAARLEEIDKLSPRI